MTCANCGGATEQTESNGATKEGRFSERYECVNCGASGWVHGRAEEPARNWSKSGRVFNA